MTSHLPRLFQAAVITALALVCVQAVHLVKEPVHTSGAAQTHAAPSTSGDIRWD